MREKVTIIHTRFEQRFGRSIGFGSLVDSKNNLIMNGSFAQLVSIIQENDFELENAQQMFELLIGLGFAS